MYLNANMISQYTYPLLEKLGESRVWVRTGLPRVRSESNPMDHKRGEPKMNEPWLSWQTWRFPKTVQLVRWSNGRAWVVQALPVRSGTGLHPGWVRHQSCLNRWDFEPKKPQPQTLTRIVSRVSRQTHLTPLISCLGVSLNLGEASGQQTARKLIYAESLHMSKFSGDFWVMHGVKVLRPIDTE